jgi:periplasmic divalent cation tolerance protein
MPSNQSVVLVLTTFPASADANAFAKALIDERLAACVSILPPMRSIYTWKEVTEIAEERQLLIKTTTQRVPELEARIKTLHPYDVPEFLVISVLDGSNDYFSWVAGSA